MDSRDYKIGVGIITCNRLDYLKKLIDTLVPCRQYIDELIIINDGQDIPTWSLPFGTWTDNEKNLGVAKSKNKALRHLLNQGCDHIFLIEDDIYIKDQGIFQAYIDASKVSGIQHFNFSQHGIMNKVGFNNNGEPNPKLTIDYKSARISLFGHCVGAFSYYSTHCLKTVGLMDERYYNACEHVDHTYEIIKAGMHPPFWNFVDIENSQDYLGDEPWTLRNSTISSSSNHKEMMKEADKIFLEKHQTLPTYITNVNKEEVYKSLKEIKSKYGNKLDSLWEGATKRKIQQIRDEWEWLILNGIGDKKDINILEIGCYDGGSSWYLSNFAKNMITIDNNVPCRFNPFELPCENYQYIGGDSHSSDMEKYFKAYDWDFVFIDGDHSFEGVKADFHNVLPFLKKGTPVAFHDIVISDFHHTHGCYVGEFWEELKKEYKATRFLEFKNNSEWAGIGLLFI